MPISRSPLVAAGFSMLISAACLADVKVRTAYTPGEDATSTFALKDFPKPSKNDAAQSGKWSIAIGQRDANGAGAAALSNGELPENPDDPAHNFFFAAGTNGGRLTLDLGKAIEIRAINSYSWHAAGRAPQVYNVFGAPDSAKELAQKANEPGDPAGRGWTLIGKVDTRQKDEARGGQYGVSIANADGVIGPYRYLLFDISAASPDDRFGNTFFSEIDVIDKKAPAPAAEAPSQPPLEVKVGKYTLVFDMSETPNLRPWVEEKLRPVCVEWYPKLVDMLPSEGFEAPARFTIRFRKDMKGVAFASGSRITCAGPWFADNLEGEARGAVVHEMVHVVQQYGRRRGANRNPGWLVEGLADYIRWFLYEPQSERPRPSAERANYNDSYRTTGHFLNYVVEKYDKKLIEKLNAAMRRGEYSEDLWKQSTGKSLEDLGAEWKKTLK